MKVRLTRWSLASLVLVLVFLGVPVGIHFHLKHKVAAYYALLREKGERLDFWRDHASPPSGTSNAASAFLNLAWRFDPPVFYWVPRGDLSNGRAVPVWRYAEWIGQRTESDWEAACSELASNEVTLAQLRQILLSSELNFPLRTNTYLVELTHLSRVKRVFEGFCLDTERAWCRQQMHLAHTNLLALWQLVESLREERLIVSQQVRLNLLALLQGLTWDGIQHPETTYDELSAWQAQWEKVEVLRPALQAFSAGMAFNPLLYAQLRERRQGFICCDFSEYLHFSRPVIALDTGIYWPLFSSYTMELAELKLAEGARDALQKMQNGQSWQEASPPWLALGEKQAGAKQRCILPSHQYGLFLHKAYQKILTTVVQVEAQRRLTVAALALARYQRKYGAYPRSLAELTPAFLPAVPLDPVDRQPLRYRLEADGRFTLYSIGADGRDDGGRSGERSLEHAPDWVWPQPATEKEFHEAELVVK
ncbi:hypothetical protein NXS98_12235 [Fontisphaera persica]|uniref:hypothetical protein n=1 Tax=Fontisphaera persica TaxID=2974023 RepID=UPI0024BF1A34|nr:hypothetical protein [Fontisphaera persica]WCJ58488.1 hypothetical protein NXS98_12235 [Fontisphaera persica]